MDEQWRDPTAANYYDEPPYLDALSAPGDVFGSIDYEDLLPVPVPDLPVAALPSDEPEKAATAPAAPVSSGSGRPAGWNRPSTQPAQPAPDWRPQAPRQSRRRAEPTATYSGVPTYQSTPTTFQNPARSDVGSPSPFRVPTATPPTVPWTRPAGFRNGRPRAARPGPTQSGTTRSGTTRRRPSAFAWLPAVFVVAVVLFLSNGGADVIRRAVDGPAVPAGVGEAVDGYYDAVAVPSAAQAASYICSSHQDAWTAGQTSATADSRRGITAHAITDKEKHGGSWDVTVRLTTRATASTSVVVGVVNEGGAYKLCGGTNP